MSRIQVLANEIDELEGDVYTCQRVLEEIDTKNSKLVLKNAVLLGADYGELEIKLTNKLVNKIKIQMQETIANAKERIEEIEGMVK